MTTPEQAKEEKAKLWAEMDAGTTPADTTLTKPEEGAAAPTDAEKAAAATPTAATNETPAEDDPYKDLPETVRHEILGLKTLLSKATERQRNTDGRLGGMQSELKQLKDALNAGKTAPGAAESPSSAELSAARSDPKAMAKLVEDYPEFGAAMKGAMEETLRPLQAQLQELRAKPAAESITSADLQAVRRELQVEAFHPNWQERVRTPQFTGWLQSQPREVQALAASDSPQDAIRLLDLNAEAGQTGVKRQERLNSAAAIPSGRQPTIRPGKPESEMTKAELWAHLDQLDANKR